TGSFEQFGLQLLGFVTVAAWAAVTMTLTFFVLSKAQKSIRVSKTEEIEGLDRCEHGLPSAYADFIGVSLQSEILEEGAMETPAAQADAALQASSAPAPLYETENTAKLSKVVIVTKQSMLETLKAALEKIGVSGITVTQVLGCGVQKGANEYYRGVKMDMSLLPKVKVEVIVSKVPVQDVIDAARKALYTGHIGDGKIFVYDVEDVVKIRTGARGYDALQDDA
ncbi:MAG: P-II family nitrogen regulator, partial [Candidatus Scatosoma sp.]